MGAGRRLTGLPALSTFLAGVRSCLYTCNNKTFCSSIIYLSFVHRLSRRRHHCRYCGGLFCSDCTPHRIQFQEQASPQRVCTICRERIAGRIESILERRFLRGRLQQQSASPPVSSGSRTNKDRPLRRPPDIDVAAAAEEIPGDS